MTRLFRSSTLAPVFLFLIIGSLCLQNYTPDTFLTGWDNLMPELNLGMNIKRSLFAVWQQYQGLGLVGGMGHATDLIRQLILLPFSLILPTSLLRYLWHFGMLFLGTYGIYFGLLRVFKYSPEVSFLSSLFYLLHFGSVQNFWVTFEPFATFWGFSPWLIFCLFDYLKKPSRHSTLRLLIVNFLAIPSFYVPTIFVVYIICIFLVFLSQPSSIRHSSKILISIFLINSFWLLPFLYFLTTNSHHPRQALANIIASQETIDRNINRGHLSDFALLRGYYTNFPTPESNILTPWTDYLAHPLPLISGYILFSLVLFGLIISLVKPSAQKISIVLIFLLSSIALLSATPPFSYLGSLLRSSDFLSQVFRSPWTKFISPAIFSFTLLFATSTNFLLTKLSAKFSFLLFTCLTSLITIFSFPSFTGHFFSPSIRQNIPQNYLDLIAYFKNVPPNARIANLPQGPLWGWTQYAWGYTGSGFLWYGLEQPVLDRAFDVWQLSNQQYYLDLHLALDRRDPKLIETILKKYNIEYVLFDNQVISPYDQPAAKLSLATPNLLSQVPNLHLLQNFASLSLYRYHLPTSPYLSPNPDDIFFSAPSPYPQPDNSIPINPISPSYTSPISHGISFSDNFYSLTSQNSHLPFVFTFENFVLNQSYKLSITTRHHSGHPLNIAILIDEDQTQPLFSQIPISSDWQTHTFTIPGLYSPDFSHTVSVYLDNPSFNSLPTRNDIRSVYLSPAPIIPTPIPTTNRLYPSYQASNNYFFYHLQIPAPPSSYLVLPQSFDPGWLAFYFDGFRPVFLTDHTLANNWANSWQLPSDIVARSSDIYILFWPQLLQFLGFLLLPIPFLWTIKSKPRHWKYLT